jgi:hypothetical protein
MFSGLTLSFSHTLRGITLEEALESTMKLCTFLLKISKVNKNGGVFDLNLCPIKYALTTTCLWDCWIISRWANFACLLSFPHIDFIGVFHSITLQSLNKVVLDLRNFH